MTDSPRSRLRLPHWGWFLLATVLLVIAAIGLAVWLPYHRERLVVKEIEGMGGLAGARIHGETDTVAPEWLKRLVGSDRLKTIQVFERVSDVSVTVTDAEIAQLRRLTNLKNLWLNDSQVTNAGLIHLSGMKNLEMLNLNGTSVTDAGLAHLDKLTNLKFLNLRATRVTEAGVGELKLALPELEVYW